MNIVKRIFDKKKSDIKTIKITLYVAVNITPFSQISPCLVIYISLLKDLKESLGSQITDDNCI